MTDQEQCAGFDSCEKEGLEESEAQCSHNCDTCGVSGCSSRGGAGIVKLTPNEVSSIKHVIGVVSGKGGVGKSLVCGLLASALAKKGLKVGILDADVTGPSVPRIFGITGRIGGDETGIIPAQSSGGVKIISANLILPEGDTPIAWRGPLVSGLIQQFYTEVNWGSIDVLLVDMPPGTSDVALTVFQSLPLDGIVTVSSPQDLVAMIVGKALNLAHSMSIEVLGLVENMAYFECDSCSKRHYLFGKPMGKEVAARYNIPAVAELPIDPAVAELCDKGELESYDTKVALDGIITAIIGAFEK